jgi:HK97 gp10 family phage protein
MSFSNASRLVTQLQNIKRTLNQKVNQALAKGAMDMANYAKEKIQSQSTSGRIYKRGSITHTASVAGAFPNSDTGTLASSIFFDMNVRSRVARFGVNDRLNYARFLEFGTSKMEARPFLRPSYNALKNEYKQSIEDAVNEALRQL